MINYHHKKIVIIGLGITGISCIDFFLNKGIIPRVIDTRLSPPCINQIPPEVEYHLGNINVDWLLNSDLIIISPGISLSHPILQKAALIGIEIIGDIELFCREVTKPIIAISGSNGKSTVTNMVSQMIKSAGLLVGVGGNIGFPALNLLKLTVNIYILELSSFQLETTFSLKPIVATILNVTEDHMDRYPLGITQYHNAKLRIYKNAKICIVNNDDKLTFPINKKNKRCVSFGINTGDYHLSYQNGNTWLCINNNLILNTTKLKIIGQHNYINSLAALALADAINLPHINSMNALLSYNGLLHRFQLVHKLNDVCWINDSKSTNIASTKAALKGLKVKNTLWLLLGGDGKSANFSSLKKYLHGDNLRLFCFGKDRHQIASLRPEISVVTSSLEEAVKKISIQVNKGDVVILSPACSSVDQFSNFEERGNKFIELVKKLN